MVQFCHGNQTNWLKLAHFNDTANQKWFERNVKQNSRNIKYIDILFWKDKFLTNNLNSILNLCTFKQ